MLDAEQEAQVHEIAESQVEKVFDSILTELNNFSIGGSARQDHSPLRKDELHEILQRAQSHS